MIHKEYEFSGSTVMIMTCSNCNTKCEHCYIGYTGNFDGKALYNICTIWKEKYGNLTVRKLKNKCKH